jgi:outer membrane receptor protein involved in Fe transport
MPEFQPSVSALTTAEIVLNEGGKEVMGVEAEFEWSPNDHWHIAAQAAWLDARFDNYSVFCLPWCMTAAESYSGRRELDGWQPAFSPEWMLGLQASYLAELGRWGSLRPVLHSRYISDYYANDLNLPGALQPAHNIIDLRLFWRLPGDKVRLQLYMENVSDEQVLNSMTIYSPPANLGITAFLADWNDGAKYGLTLSYSY